MSQQKVKREKVGNAQKVSGTLERTKALDKGS